MVRATMVYRISSHELSLCSNGADLSHSHKCPRISHTYLQVARPESFNTPKRFPDPLNDD